MTPKLQNSELEFHRADLPSVEDLNRKQEWFCDPARVPADNAGPFVRVLDGFYSDPEAMRSLAVALPYAQYSPPLVEDVGEEIAARWKKPGRWLASVNFVFHGTRIEHAFPGTRANPGWLREKIAGFLGKRSSASPGNGTVTAGTAPFT